MAQKILGISISTKRIGVALFEGLKLRDWKVSTFSAKWSMEKLEDMITYVDDWMVSHGIEVVALKIPDIVPISQNYIQLIGSLNIYFERKNVKVVCYALADLKHHYCPNSISSKIHLAQCMASKYPELILAHHKEASNRNKYYDKAFEAIAAAYLLSSTVQ